MNWFRAVQNFNTQLKADVASRHYDATATKPDSKPLFRHVAHLVILIVDHSISMGEADYPPSRLQAALAAASESVSALAEQSIDAHIGAISFNHSAHVVAPLTAVSGHREIIEAIRSVRVAGGTDISAGLKQAVKMIGRHPANNAQIQIILLTDGHGGEPVAVARKLKQQYHATLDVVGIGGSPEAVNESLLRKVATTEPNGYNHYRFIKDAHTLKQHYRQLATGLVWKGHDK